MYLIIIFLPLLASITILLFGRIIGRSGSTMVIIFSMLLSLMASFYLLTEVAFSGISTRVYFFE